MIEIFYGLKKMGELKPLLVNYGGLSLIDVVVTDVIGFDILVEGLIKNEGLPEAHRHFTLQFNDGKGSIKTVLDPLDPKKVANFIKNYGVFNEETYKFEVKRCMNYFFGEV